MEHYWPPLLPGEAGPGDDGAHGAAGGCGPGLGAGRDGAPGGHRAAVHTAAAGRGRHRLQTGEVRGDGI